MLLLQYVREIRTSERIKQIRGYTEVSSSGKTADFDSVIVGSIPATSANSSVGLSNAQCILFHPHKICRAIFIINEV